MLLIWWLQLQTAPFATRAPNRRPYCLGSEQARALAGFPVGGEEAQDQILGLVREMPSVMC